MANSRADLDAAIAANTAIVAKAVSDIAALLAALSAAGVAEDFTSEVNAVAASTSALTASDVSAEGVLTPPPAPAPATGP